MSVFILSLPDPQAALENVGGKGMSLARLARLGLPVPSGFHITTEAYRRFVAVNDLQAGILEALLPIDLSLPASLEVASSRIAGRFAAARMQDDLASEIRLAYAELCGSQPDKPVAVRSSATAEDLPEASFAGQQDTYLNLRGADAVLDAVQRCWASLWTARAISYRLGQGIAPESVALAVVVQELVPADASGVMFTANPISGKRNEIMITAAWGLGEAIVSGAVTPDTLTLEKSTGKLLRRDTAEKLLMTVRTASGTREEPVPASRRKKPVLNDAQARTLARLGADIDRHYGMPMDIEWTLASGKIAIVQARPVTALPEPPAGQALEWPLPHPKAMMARGSFAEFVPEPVSPLFATLALPIASKATARLMGDFIGIEESYILTAINDYVYVGFVFTPKITWKMLVATIGATKTLLKNARERAEASRLALRAAIEKWSACQAGTFKPSELLDAACELFAATAVHYTVAQSGPIPSSMMSEMIFARYYNSLVKRKGDPEACRFVFGIDNHASRADRALYDLAMWVRTQPAIEDYLLRTPAGEIAVALSGQRPSDHETIGLSDFSSRFAAYLNEYGHAIYDLDFAKPVPAEDPAPLLETLKVYLQGKNNPYERQAAARELREQAAPLIARRLDPLRRKYFLKLLNWAQDQAPLREDAIADLGLTYPLIHTMLGELGRRLVEGGAISCAQDVYWLELSELQALAARLEQEQPLTSYAAQVEQRKAKWQTMRSVTAPTTLPKVGWLKMFYPAETVGLTIKGFGASAGRVTARACVMLGPEDFGKMQPGDVIVAGITTPAWTPLFARAAAIVTDIGGPLSHSSIVAREYGIPAVLATGVATRRIKDGQLITVDGKAGTVVPAATR